MHCVKVGILMYVCSSFKCCRKNLRDQKELLIHEEVSIKYYESSPAFLP